MKKIYPLLLLFLLLTLSSCGKSNVKFSEVQFENVSFELENEEIERQSVLILQVEHFINRLQNAEAFHFKYKTDISNKYLSLVKSKDGIAKTDIEPIIYKFLVPSEASDIVFEQLLLIKPLVETTTFKEATFISVNKNLEYKIFFNDESLYYEYYSTENDKQEHYIFKLQFDEDKYMKFELLKSSDSQTEYKVYDNSVGFLHYLKTENSTFYNMRNFITNKEESLLISDDTISYSLYDYDYEKKLSFTKKTDASIIYQVSILDNSLPEVSYQEKYTFLTQLDSTKLSINASYLDNWDTCRNSKLYNGSHEITNNISINSQDLRNPLITVSNVFPTRQPQGQLTSFTGGSSYIGSKTMNQLILLIEDTKEIEPNYNMEYHLEKDNNNNDIETITFIINGATFDSYEKAQMYITSNLLPHYPTDNE